MNTITIKECHIKNQQLKYNQTFDGSTIINKLLPLLTKIYNTIMLKEHYYFTAQQYIV